MNPSPVLSLSQVMKPLPNPSTIRTTTNITPSGIQKTKKSPMPTVSEPGQVPTNAAGAHSILRYSNIAPPKQSKSSTLPSSRASHQPGNREGASTLTPVSVLSPRTTIPRPYYRPRLPSTILQPSVPPFYAQCCPPSQVCSRG